MPPPVLTISAARQTFFDLFEDVTSHHGNKILITSRGVRSRAVLVAETYLSDLELAAKRLREIESGKVKPGRQFKLSGSLRIAPGAADPLAEVRTKSDAQWRKKAASFGD